MIADKKSIDVMIEEAKKQLDQMTLQSFRRALVECLFECLFEFTRADDLEEREQFLQKRNQ